jgi:D-amino-acid dehydrogenase
MKVLVLGAGVVGTTSAWFLSRLGHEVTVVDRQPVAGLETSFANAGQISASHAQPWANPSAPMTILKWLGREDAPLLFRLRADAAQWSWALRFLRECLPGRTRRNTLQLLALSVYSRAVLKQLREESGIRYDHLSKGILHLHSEHRTYATASEHADMYANMGCRIDILSAAQCLQVEPALAKSSVPLVGGTYAPEDESGDAHAFTRSMEQYAIAHGVQFRFGQSITGFAVAGNKIEGVHVRNLVGGTEILRADAYVSCLGCESPIHLRGLGLSIPLFPVKGYSVTIPIERPDCAPQVSVTHESSKIACSRLGSRLRVAGTAELTGYDTTITPARCDSLLVRARELFPDAGGYSYAQRWAGLRPTTPGNVPLIGKTRYSNFFLNTGHGTLGWTLACGSGKAIADIVSERKPAVDFAFLQSAANRTL